MYPHASIWTTGHSLGGALASLTAMSNSIPAFTYEAPGELLYAQRVGLVKSFEDALEKERVLRSMWIYQFGNPRDPVFMGMCNGPARYFIYFFVGLKGMFSHHSLVLAHVTSLATRWSPDVMLAKCVSTLTK